MEPGELRHRVTIQRRIDTTNDRGGPVETYEDWFESWAEVRDLTPREQFQAQQVGAEITKKVRIRYRPGLDEKCRIRWVPRGGQSPTVFEYLDVAGPPIAVDGRANELWLMCVKRSPENFRTGVES